MTPSERAESLQLIKSVIEPGVAQLNEQISEFKTGLTDRIVALEQKRAFGTVDVPQHGSAGLMDHVLKSEQFASLLKGNTTRASIELPKGMLNATKAAIVSQGQDLSPAMRMPGVVAHPLRAKRIRDLMPVGVTGNNLVEFTRENVFTNNAAPQYASPATENVAKAESGITFTLEEAPVRTLAHFVPVSKQVLSDASYMQSYVSTRLMQGLKVKEDLQLLAGDGSGGGLVGILATGNFVAAPAGVSGENALDRILRTLAAIAVDEMTGTGILLHPNDWADLQIIKSADSGEYLLGSPGQTTAPSLWGVPVVASTAIDEGTFLVGDWGMGAQVWDREQATVQVSFEHSDNFTKNMATILVEERLALTVYRPKAFRKGTF